MLCDTIIGKPVHSFRSSSGDARPTYSSWMVAAMMAATPIQLPVRAPPYFTVVCMLASTVASPLEPVLHTETLLAARVVRLSI